MWNFILAGDSWVPRAQLRDNEPAAPPLEQRFQRQLPEEMALVRSSTENLFPPGAADSGPLNEAALQQLGAEIDDSFAPALRRHILILLDESAPYYLARLSPPELARHRFAYQAVARLWRDHGIACEISGDGFEPADYVDRAHLSSDGGNKLARLVASRILQLNQP